MIADEVELVAVKAGLCRNVQAFPQFAVENQVAQALALHKILEGLHQAYAEKVGNRERIGATVLQDCG